MSRGGRGGARGGGARGRGGGFGGRGKHVIAGQEMSWDYDPDIETKSDPMEWFPNLKEDFPRPASASIREKKALVWYKKTRKMIQKGPLHTVLSDKTRIGKPKVTKQILHFNPFNDLEEYSKKYKPSQQTLPNWNTRSYPTHLFPEELHEVFQKPRSTKAAPKKPAPRRFKRIVNVDDEDEPTAYADAEPDEEIDAETGKRKPDDDEEPEEDEPDPDENFEEDEDEMAGDYNAEAYFSGGEGDDDDMAMGADDGGGDFD